MVISKLPLPRVSPSDGQFLVQARTKEIGDTILDCLPTSFSVINFLSRTIIVLAFEPHFWASDSTRCRQPLPIIIKKIVKDETLLHCMVGY